MRRFIAVVLASLLVFASTPLTSAAAKSTGTITGVAKVHRGPAARRPFRTSAKRQNRRRGRDGDDQRHRQLCRPESRSGQLRGRDRRHRRKDCRHERDCHRRRGKHCIVGGDGSLDRARWRCQWPCPYRSSRRRQRRGNHRRHRGHHRRRGQPVTIVRPLTSSHAKHCFVLPSPAAFRIEQIRLFAALAALP